MSLLNRDLNADGKVAAIIVNHKKNMSEQVERFNFEKSDKAQHSIEEIEGQRS